MKHEPSPQGKIVKKFRQAAARIAPQKSRDWMWSPGKGRFILFIHWKGARATSWVLLKTLLSKSAPGSTPKDCKKYRQQSGGPSALSVIPRASRMGEYPSRGWRGKSSQKRENPPKRRWRCALCDGGVGLLKGDLGRKGGQENVFYWGNFELKVAKEDQGGQRRMRVSMAVVQGVCNSSLFFWWSIIAYPLL